VVFKWCHGVFGVIAFIAVFTCVSDKCPSLCHRVR
jgi:hypothetical protein